MTIWLQQHGAALKQALRHLLKAPGSFLMNVLVVAVAFALPLAGLTILENVRPVSEQLSVDPEMSIFLSLDTPREKATALMAPIYGILHDANSFGKVEFIPREKALDTLKDKTGLADALTALGSNPLPDAFVVKLSGFENANEANRIDTIAARLKSLPGVEYVQVDSAWVKRLAALLHILRLALLFLAITLGMVVVTVIFNTIRLQVMTQRDEIEISRLFGATDAFIYRPFYYAGSLLGLCAGALSLAVVGLGLYPLNAAITEFAHFYASQFQITPLSLLTTLLFLAAGMLLGLLGAALSVKRHLSRLAAY